MRLIFMGTPPLAAVCLQALMQSTDCEVVAVVTQPDRPKGRDLKLQPSPVKALALTAKVPVLQPERARNEDFLAQLRAAQPELIAVAAYGQILPPGILQLPRFGCLNVHTSLLPKYRGAAPIQWAIINGDTETGVTIMKMDAGMDTGPIVTQQATPIQTSDTSETLHDRLAVLGADLLLRTIPDYVAGKVPPQAQPAAGASYAPRIKKQDGQIDWQQPASAIWNRARGLMPWPGAFTHLGTPASAPASSDTTGASKPPPSRLLKIWQAQVCEVSGHPGEILKADKTGILITCGQGALLVEALQLEGGRRLSAGEFLAGHPLRPGLRLS
jgi:methionyl-tRNA formyltransferase